VTAAKKGVQRLYCVQHSSDILARFSAFQVFGWRECGRASRLEFVQSQHHLLCPRQWLHRQFKKKASAPHSTTRPAGRQKHFVPPRVLQRIGGRPPEVHSPVPSLLPPLQRAGSSRDPLSYPTLPLLYRDKCILGRCTLPSCISYLHGPALGHGHRQPPPPFPLREHRGKAVRQPFSRKIPGNTGQWAGGFFLPPQYAIETCP